MQDHARNAIEYLRAHRFFSTFSVDELAVIVDHLRLRQIPAHRPIAEVREISLLLMLHGDAMIKTTSIERACTRGTVISQHWAGPRHGLLFADHDATVLELTPAHQESLRTNHPAITRRLQHRLAATGAQTSPVGAVWSGRRTFRRRPNRSMHGNESRTPSFELVSHSRMILSMV